MDNQDTQANLEWLTQQLRDGILASLKATRVPLYDALAVKRMMTREMDRLATIRSLDHVAFDVTLDTSTQTVNVKLTALTPFGELLIQRVMDAQDAAP